MEINIGTLQVQSGEKKTGFLTVEEGAPELPLTVICGEKEGKTVLITAGVHGGEYPGIQAAIELAKELTPQKISGQVIVVHPVNVGAFAAIVPQVVPADNKNLNRAFPGNPEGTYTEKLAHCMEEKLFSLADFYMDLHGGDLQEEVTPFAYFPGIGEENVVTQSLKAAECLHVKYLVQSGAKTGAYNYAAMGNIPGVGRAAVRGIPSILIERGGRGLISKQEVDDYKRDLYRVLKYLEVVYFVEREAAPQKQIFTDVHYITCGQSGCWHYFVKPGEHITKGQPLGEVRDFFGNTLHTYISELDAVVLYMYTCFSVGEGDEIFCCGEVKAPTAKKVKLKKIR